MSEQRGRHHGAGTEPDAAFWAGAKAAYDAREAQAQAVYAAQLETDVEEFLQAFPGIAAHEGTGPGDGGAPTWTIIFQGTPLTVQKYAGTAWKVSTGRSIGVVMASEGHAGLYAACLKAATGQDVTPAGT